MILITGIPNAGKTTYSKRFDNVIHFDEVKGRDRRNKVVSAVVDNNNICVEGVYGTPKERIPLIQASDTYNVCIWLDTSVEECVYREVHGRNRSERLVQWAYEEYIPPTLDEGWDEIRIIKDGKETDIIRKT